MDVLERFLLRFLAMAEADGVPVTADQVVDAMVDKFLTDRDTTTIDVARMILRERVEAAEATWGNPHGQAGGVAPLVA
jgi:hypothetical protein